MSQKRTLMEALEERSSRSIGSAGGLEDLCDAIADIRMEIEEICDMLDRRHRDIRVANRKIEKLEMDVAAAHGKIEEQEMVIQTLLRRIPEEPEPSELPEWANSAQSEMVVGSSM